MKGSGRQTATAGAAAVERRTAVAALLGGVLLLANLVVQFGLARVAANRAIVIMLSELAVAALAAWLLADEALVPREWLGGAIIISASLLTARRAGTSPA